MQPASYNPLVLLQGVSLALGTLSGNIVGNFALTALAELPAYLTIAAMSGKVNCMLAFMLQ